MRLSVPVLLAVSGRILAVLVQALGELLERAERPHHIAYIDTQLFGRLGPQSSAPGRAPPVNFEASSSMSSDTVLPIGRRRALENRSVLLGGTPTRGG